MINSNNNFTKHCCIENELVNCSEQEGISLSVIVLIASVKTTSGNIS